MNHLELQREFWEYSVALYGDEQVKTICLQMQDEHRCQVNILLFALWYGVRWQDLLRDDDVQLLRISTEQWQNAIKDIRNLRRELEAVWKKPRHGFWSRSRKHLLESELLMEAGEQHVMVDSLLPLLSSYDARGYYLDQNSLMMLAMENLETAFRLMTPSNEAPKTAIPWQDLQNLAAKAVSTFIDSHRMLQSA